MSEQIQHRWPTGFDPAAHPILSRHWFGVEPFHSGQIAAELMAGLRRRHHVQQVHRLGDRVLDEMLIEIGNEYGIATGINQTVERYAALDPEALKLAGGDHFPPAPIHEVS